MELGPYSGPHGGVRTNLLAIRRVLFERGIRCAIVNLTHCREEDRADVYYPKSAIDVFALLMRERCDVIHLHIGGMITGRELALCALCSVLPGTKTVLTYHSGGYPSSAQGKRAHPWTVRGAIFRRFDAIIAVNDELAKLFERYGVRRERIHLIPPYAVAALSEEAQLPERLEQFFQQYSPVLLAVAQLEPEYDLALQIDVLPRVRARFPNAGLMIIGDGSLRDTLAGRILQSSCAQNVALCGDVEHAQALQAIRRADVLLRTTRYDGDAISVREALHFGTPVIATDNGMRPEGVHSIDVANGEQLYDAIEKVLLQPAHRSPVLAADDRHIHAVVNLYQALVSAEARIVANADVSPRT